jgi:hypothetical protein
MISAQQFDTTVQIHAGGVVGIVRGHAAVMPGVAASIGAVGALIVRRVSALHQVRVHRGLLRIVVVVVVVVAVVTVQSGSRVVYLGPVRVARLGLLRGSPGRHGRHRRMKNRSELVRSGVMHVHRTGLNRHALAVDHIRRWGISLRRTTPGEHHVPRRGALIMRGVPGPLELWRRHAGVGVLCAGVLSRGWGHPPRLLVVRGDSGGVGGRGR